MYWSQNFTKKVLGATPSLIWPISKQVKIISKRTVLICVKWLLNESYKKFNQSLLMD